MASFMVTSVILISVYLIVSILLQLCPQLVTMPSETRGGLVHGFGICAIRNQWWPYPPCFHSKEKRIHLCNLMAGCHPISGQEVGVVQVPLFQNSLTVRFVSPCLTF